MEINSLKDFGKLMSPQDVAAFLGVSPATVCNVAEEFGGIRVGDDCVFFENVFLDRLKNKIFRCPALPAPLPPRVGITDVAEEMKQLEDRHGIFAG